MKGLHVNPLEKSVCPMLGKTLRGFIYIAVEYDLVLLVIPANYKYDLITFITRIENFHLL